MPLVTLTVRKPKSSVFKTTMLNAVHDALVSAGVPASDKFQRIIEGGPVGDKQRFWAEGAELCLPNSKICIAYARGLHDYARGCDGEPDCYETVVPTAVPLRVTSLNPDIPVRFTLADYANRRDAALDAILAVELRRDARIQKQGQLISASTRR